MTAVETKDEGVNQDLAGEPGEFYSMGGSHAKSEGMTRTDTEPVHTATVQERRKEDKNKKEGKSPDRDLLYWRIGIGLMVILIVVGVVYFVAQGINWGIKKVAGTGQPTATVSTTVLRSNADPLSAQPTGPVISDKNMVPVGTPSNSSTIQSTRTGQVAGTSTQAVNRNNNCPDYASEYYYCEWIDQYTYRPYRTEQEYLDSRNAPRSYSTRSYSYTPEPVVYTPPAPSYYYPQYHATTPVLPANGCPDYEQGNYRYCRWIDQYTYQGYR